MFIVTVPTPIDAYRLPDLGPLLAASRTVGRALKPGDVVISESTVYRGATKEDCAPVLAAEPEAGSYDAVILTVPHREFVALGGEDVRRLGAENAVVFDVKSVLPVDVADLRL